MLMNWDEKKGKNRFLPGEKISVGLQKEEKG